MGRVLFIKKFRILSQFLRNISSEILTNELNNGIRKEIEEYWSKRLIPKRGSNNFHASSVLYPASIMLSENLRILAIKNAILRYHQMNDCQVHEAEYWHSHQNPAEDRCESFCRLKRLVVDTKSQLEKLRLAVVDREFSYNSPEFCQRSRFLFLKLYNAGVIYQKKTLVNDSVEMDDIIQNDVPKMCGKSKTLTVSERWFLRTSQFAHDFCQHLHSEEALLKCDIDRLHKSWTGLCEGYSFDCVTDYSEKLNVWVSDLSLIPQAEFIAIKPNSLFDHLCGESRNANGKLKMNAINPVTSKELPVYLSEDLAYPFGRETYLGVPAVFESDRRFAEKVGLKFGNSDRFSSSVTENLDLKFDRVSSQHGDWPISQNFVASVPVPLVRCPDCGFQPSPEQELPITLPPLPENLRKGDIDVILKTNDWITTVCPNCGGSAVRERTFIDPLFLSCTSIFRNDKTNKLIPVDLFTCGGDQALYHLYFSRFLTHIIHSLGLSTIPLNKILFNNSISNQTTSHCDQEKGSKFDEIMDNASEPLPKESENNKLILNNIKNEFGYDFCHLLLLFSSKNEKFQWDQNVQTEMLTWQNNLWLTIREFVGIRERPLAFVSPWIDVTHEDKKLKELRNISIRLATLDYCDTFDMMNCITVLRKLTNKLRTYTREARKLSVEYEKSLAALIIMLAPLMPHFAATLWMAFCSAKGRLMPDGEEIAWNENVMLQKWPKIDNDFEIPVTLRINSDFILNGGTLLPHEISELTVDKALDIAKKSRDVRRCLKKNRILDMKLKTVPNLQAELIVLAESKAEPEKVLVEQNRVEKENK